MAGDEVACTPLPLRTYCRAAASISAGVALGSRPRNVVMLRHKAPTVPACIAGVIDWMYPCR